MALSRVALKNATLGLLKSDLYVQNRLLDNHSDWGAVTSLTLATIDSLSRGYNATALMDQFLNWYTRGDYTVMQHPQQAGEVTQAAMEHYLKNHDPLASGGTREEDNGNGALMRIMPAIFYLRNEYGAEFTANDTAMFILQQIGGLTHNHPRALLANGLFAMFVNALLDDQTPHEAFEDAIVNTYEYYAKQPFFTEDLKAFNELNLPDFQNTPKEDIVASDYVVDTLSAALWVILNTENYDDALALALDIQGTPAAIMPLVGTIAGLIYGESEPIEVPELPGVSMNMINRYLSLGEKSQRFSTDPI